MSQLQNLVSKYIGLPPAAEVILSEYLILIPLLTTKPFLSCPFLYFKTWYKDSSCKP